MTDGEQGVRNEASGLTYGPVVQAGSIQQVWLGEPTPVDAARTGRPSMPRQLPLVVRDFTGRAEHLAALDTLLPCAPADEKTAGTAVISAVDGTAGIGKTTLAVWWAHRVQHRFPDGTLYVNLRGYGPGEPATTSEVLDGFLRALGVAAERMPAGVEERAALFRSVLAGRRVLIVLDNANSADQVRPLLPGAPGGVVVVTSRDSLTGLVVTEGATRLTLDLLAQDEAVQLVTGILGPARAVAEAGAVTELVRWCARLPLALRIAAGQAAAYPHSTVAEVVTELADERGRLEVLSRGRDERAAVRAVFDWSYQRLPADHARLFRYLGLHPGPDLSVAAAAAVADLHPPIARRLLDELAEAHLIEPAAGSRYRFHDLLRAYAAEQVVRLDNLADRDCAQRALLDWYAYTARTCDTLLFPVHYRLPDWPTTPTHPTSIPDRARALDWFNAERGNLLAALHHTVHHGLHRHTVELADSARFLFMSGRWHELLDAESCGVAAAQHRGDRAAETWFRFRRAEWLLTLRRWDEARTDFDQALALARDLGDRAHQAGILSSLGQLWLEQGRFEESLRRLREALPLSRGVDTGRWEAAVEGNLCRACTGLGHHRQALEHGERGLALRRQVGDLAGEAVALQRLAQAWQGLGEHQKTMVLCWEAIALGRTVGSQAETVAEPLDTLAISLHHTGDTTAAITCWQEAATILDDHGRPHDADQVRGRLHAAQAT